MNPSGSFCATGAGMFTSTVTKLVLISNFHKVLSGHSLVQLAVRHSMTSLTSSLGAILSVTLTASARKSRHSIASTYGHRSQTGSCPQHRLSLLLPKVLSEALQHNNKLFKSLFSVVSRIRQRNSQEKAFASILSKLLLRMTYHIHLVSVVE